MKGCRNESFDFPCSAATPRLYAELFDHHTIGKDKPLGEAEVDVRISVSYLAFRLTHLASDQIWQHIQPVGQSAADVFVEMRGEGKGILKLRLSFDSDPPSGRKSFSSGDRSMFVSPSKFSVRGRRATGVERPKDDDSR